MTSIADARTGFTSRSFRAIGTTATVVVQDPGTADAAQRELSAELEAIDRDLQSIQRRLRAPAGARRVRSACPVSDLLYQALDVAVTAAERTGGAVDPTIGNALAALGYDADLDSVLSRPPAPAPRSGRSPDTRTCS